MFIISCEIPKENSTVQYIPRNMHTVFALLCFVVVIHWLIFPYPSGLLHWHCGNLTIAPVAAKQPWWIWINISYEFIMNDCITTTKQSTTKPCAYFLGYTVAHWGQGAICSLNGSLLNAPAHMKFSYRVFDVCAWLQLHARNNDNITHATATAKSCYCYVIEAELSYWRCDLDMWVAERTLDWFNIKTPS